MPRNLLVHCIATVLLAVMHAGAGAWAGAQPSTFRISQVFSNLDGSIQFVELTESAGLNGQHRLAGLRLTSTHKDSFKEFIFPHDLPTNQTAHISIVVATSWLWVLDDSPIAPDVLGLPPRFLPTDGGTLEFAGIDRVTYASLPTDGVSALYRDADANHATFPSNGRCPGMSPTCDSRFKIDQSEVFAIEYYHAGRDHYFVSSSAPDIDALDSGRLSGWTRTGYGLHVGGALSAADGLDQPVCRFYIPPGEGDSHFVSASTEECEAVRSKFPGFVLENNATFYAALPHPVSGHCGTAFWPGNDFSVQLFQVYRLWNGRLDSNHRYTTDFEIRGRMIQRGYVSEGYGPLGVAMCVLPATPWDYQQ